MQKLFKPVLHNEIMANPAQQKKARKIKRFTPAGAGRALEGQLALKAIKKMKQSQMFRVGPTKKRVILAKAEKGIKKYGKEIHKKKEEAFKREKVYYDFRRFMEDPTKMNRRKIAVRIGAPTVATGITGNIGAEVLESMGMDRAAVATRFALLPAAGLGFAYHKYRLSEAEKKKSQMLLEQRIKNLEGIEKELLNEIKSSGGLKAREKRRNAEEELYYLYSGGMGPQTFGLRENPYIKIKKGKEKTDVSRAIDARKRGDLKSLSKEEAKLISGEYAYMLYEGSIGLREEMRYKFKNDEVAKLMKDIYEREKKVNKQIQEMESKQNIFERLRFSKVKKEIIKMREDLLRARLKVYNKAHPRHTRKAVAKAIRVIEEGRMALKNRKLKKQMTSIEKKRLKRLMKASGSIIERARELGIKPTIKEVESILPGTTSLRKTPLTDTILEKRGEAALLDMFQFEAGASESKGMRELKSNIMKDRINAKRKAEIEREIRIRGEELNKGGVNVGEHKHKTEITNVINETMKKAKEYGK